jgi:hypothetical protein
LNEQPEPINDAEVKVEDGTNTYSFVTGGTNGKYYSTEPFAVSINRTFKLIIEYQGLHDTAMAVMEPISPLKNDTIASENGLYKFVYRGSDPGYVGGLLRLVANPNIVQLMATVMPKVPGTPSVRLTLLRNLPPIKKKYYFLPAPKSSERNISLSAGHQNLSGSYLLKPIGARTI